MFYGCKGNAFTMNNVFNLPSEIIFTGKSFAWGMFMNCQGNAFMMNEVFNFPSGITSIGNEFAKYMFWGCFGDSFTMNDVFTMPNGIINAGNDFASEMFIMCYGAAFNMGKNFNLPSKIASVGDNFAKGMFFSCARENFTMNDVFTMPSGITSVGNYFANGMFQYCAGESFTMGRAFNMPDRIESMGHSFAYEMFSYCFGASFTMNSVFNLPSVSTVNTSFANKMFWFCDGAAFQVNDVFVFPKLDSAELNKPGVFSYTFYYVNGAPTQNRTATSIINGNEVPNDWRETFGYGLCFPDYDHIHANWGGGGKNADNILVVSHSSLTFPERCEGYVSADTRVLTVYNLGGIAIENATRALAAGNDFILGNFSSTSILPGENATFTVTPKHGLQAGFHIGTVIIGADVCAPVSITFNFTVSARDNSHDLPNWDGIGILITGFKVTPTVGGDFEIFMEFACETAFVLGELQLHVHEDLALPPVFKIPLPTLEPAPPMIHSFAKPPHQRISFLFIFLDVPDRAFFKIEKIPCE